MNEQNWSGSCPHRAFSLAWVVFHGIRLFYFIPHLYLVKPIFLWSYKADLHFILQKYLFSLLSWLLSEDVDADYCKIIGCFFSLQAPWRQRVWPSSISSFPLSFLKSNSVAHVLGSGFMAHLMPSLVTEGLWGMKQSVWAMWRVQAFGISPSCQQEDPIWALIHILHLV